MKKVILVICLVAAMFSVMGCDSRPVDFDHRADGWELWREGTIERKKIIMETRGSSTKQRVFSLEFVNGEDVKSTRFYKWEDIKEGTTGFLYCWNGMDNDNTYMWVDSGIAPITSSPKKKPKGGLSLTIKTGKFCSEETKEEEIIDSPKRYNWQNLLSPSPSYQTVLVKFENGLVTTAYITSIGDWKSEMDRKKLSGGIALKEVSKWKLVDLE